jgi:hypothetical protein
MLLARLGRDGHSSSRRPSREWEEFTPSDISREIKPPGGIAPVNSSASEISYIYQNNARACEEKNPTKALRVVLPHLEHYSRRVPFNVLFSKALLPSKDG